MILMPLIKYLFSFTDLINTAFQVLPIGQNLDGSRYYVFDYAAGSISQGGGGGMAYFLAVEITLFNTAFQVLPIGQNLDGSRYYVFDYAAGSISQGGGGGMAYFLAVEITLFAA